MTTLNQIIESPKTAIEIIHALYNSVETKEKVQKRVFADITQLRDDGIIFRGTDNKWYLCNE